MTEREAKRILRQRYERKGYKVLRIARKGEQFYVIFGKTETGEGCGPSGLTSLRCNWPHHDSGVQQEFLFRRRRKSRKKEEDF